MQEVIQRYKNWGGLGYRRAATSLSETMKGYERDLMMLCLYLRNPHIESIIEPQITAYFREMLDLGWNPNGLMCKSIAIRNLFEYAKRIGLAVLDHELIQIIPRQIKIPRVAEDWEIDKLLETVPAESSNLLHVRNRAMVLFLRSTGCRNSEMVSLNVDQLLTNFSEQRVLIKTAKSRGVKPIRELYWDDETHTALIGWLQAREILESKLVFHDPDALFVGVRNWQIGHRLTIRGVGIAFRAMSRRAGVPTVNPHSLRHHRGREIIANGGSNSVASDVLGHSSLASSFIYTHLSNDKLRESADKYRNPNVKPQ